VAPIPFDLPSDEFDTLISSLNGALITGGETDIKTLTSPYMLAAGKLYNHSLALHAAGEVWPLWGTCMGMQVLSVLGARDPSVLLSNAYDSEGIVLPLTLTAAAAQSRLLCDTCLHPAEALHTLRTANSTVNLQCGSRGRRRRPTCSSRAACARTARRVPPHI
jgi:gamma-glutamyl hydrolase